MPKGQPTVKTKEFSDAFTVKTLIFMLQKHGIFGDSLLNVELQ